MTDDKNDAQHKQLNAKIMMMPCRQIAPKKQRNSFFASLIELAKKSQSRPKEPYLYLWMGTIIGWMLAKYS